MLGPRRARAYGAETESRHLLKGVRPIWMNESVLLPPSEVSAPRRSRSTNKNAARSQQAADLMHAPQHRYAHALSFREATSTVHGSFLEVTP